MAKYIAQQVTGTALRCLSLSAIRSHKESIIQHLDIKKDEPKMTEGSGSGEGRSWGISLVSYQPE